MDTKDAPQIINHSLASVSYVPHAACWVPHSICCFAGGEAAKRTGDLEVYRLSDAQLKRQHHKETKSGIKCMAAAHSPASGRCILTGHFDGTLSAWDSECVERAVWQLKAHETVANAVSAHPKEPLAVTGGREGTVKVWDLRTKQSVVSLEPAEGEEAAECWAVCWGDCTEGIGRGGVIGCGYDNGDVKLFDLRSMRLLTERNLDYGVCGIATDRADICLNKLLVAALEGRLFTADLRTCHPEEGYAFGEQQISAGTIWGVYPLPQNREIAAASCGSGTVTVLLYSYPEQRSLTDPETGLARGIVGTQQVLNDAEVSSQPVVAWDWHPQKTGLAVCASLDQQIRLTVVTKLNLY
ncbi:WD domain, G-beta repeat-containing protein, putative [Eimeria tenella]|uniref:WD domain, G-beta repeat-containing protein, putative n=1 Tax=Eimeria tenella TaxID=5802 RepID=U6L9H4_EIMTE|nr:WD domain, G-beta repeat-containing protein, putative [Eimeria tenella]CDJ45214.1 WD domain, G-beta repeat-containing protein, putative [Eimeria tenella]|eukprot:XP_013235961.1 WD domain, G-beta repeat-containing protein, putative [Eimeria tenella]